MTRARCLLDPWRLRAWNAGALDRFNAELGTALGYRTRAGSVTDEPVVIVYVPRKTDHLVIGEGGAPFSESGDSGKLVVTDDAERRPVGMLWGGWTERVRCGRGLEKTSYLVAIDRALRALDCEIVPEA